MAITIDANSTARTNNTGTAFTATHTTAAGSDRGLLVIVSSTSQGLPTGCTYAGQALTSEGNAQESDAGKRISFWSLVAPAVGTNNLVVSYGTAVEMALTSITFQGVHQTDMCGAFTASVGTLSNVQIGVSSTAGDVVVDGITAVTNRGTAGAQQVQISNHSTSAGAVINGTSRESGSATTTMSWSFTAATALVHAGINVHAASAAATATPTTVTNITIDTTTTVNTQNTGNFLTATHACAGTNRGLLVFIASTSQSTPHNVQYAGIGMTQEVACQEVDTGKRMAIWSLIGPPTGNNTVSMSFSAAAAAAITVVSLQGVDQSDMVDATSSANATDAAPTLSIASAAGDRVFDGIVYGGTTATPGAGQTELAGHSNPSIATKVSYEGGGATVTMSWALGVSTMWGQCAVNVQAAAESSVISQGPTGSSITIFSVANNSTENSGTNLQMAVDVSGTARALVVFIANSTQNLAHSVTYAGSAMTMEGFTRELPSGKYISVWSLIAPTTGSNTLSMHFSAAVSAAVTAFALENVDQVDCVGGYSGASGSNASPGLSISCGTGDLIFDGVCFDTGNAGPTGVGQSHRSDEGVSGALLGTSSKPGSGPQQTQWALSGVDDWAIGGVNVKPFVEKEGKSMQSIIMLMLQGRRGIADYDFYSLRQPPMPDNVSSSAGPSTPGQSSSHGPRVSLPPQDLANEEQWRRQAQAWMQEANQGRINNTGTVTLDANSSSTVVHDARVGVDSFIGLMPRTANAANEQGNGTVYVICSKNSFTIAHANNGQTDRTFTYSILG